MCFAPCRLCLETTNIIFGYEGRFDVYLSLTLKNSGPKYRFISIYWVVDLAEKCLTNEVHNFWWKNQDFYDYRFFEHSLAQKNISKV